MLSILPGAFPRSMPVRGCLLVAASLWSASDARVPVRPGSVRSAAPEQADQAEQISAYVREVFQDRDGVFWFGTNGDGVCRWDGASLTYFSVKEGFGGVAVRGILQAPDGALWFATDGGVTRYESGVFTNYTVANGLCDNEVWSLMQDRAGTLWVGTHRGVCRFDGESFVPFPLPRVAVENPTSRFSPEVVFGMFEDPAGHLWFGTDGEGVHEYDGESFTTYTANRGPLVHDQLHRVTSRGGAFSEPGLAGNRVRCIAGDRLGRIWIGTDGGGVSCYDGTTFRTFTAKDGLNNDRVFEILEDRAGHLWFSTLGAGACRYDGTTFRAFGVDQGLTVNEFPCPCGSGKTLGACHGPTGGHVQEFFEDRDGILWFGCSGGLFRLDGDALVNVTRSGPWPASPQAPAAARNSGPMARFAPMVPGAWRVTYPNGHMVDTWHWGPGRHSVRVVTEGTAGSGEPWRDLLVLYEHPGREPFRMLGLDPFLHGVSEGTMSFTGERADAVFELHQAGGLRRMGLRWIFDGPDRYDETLLEATGDAGYTVLNGPFEFVRVEAHAATDARVAGDGPGPSERLGLLEFLVGHTWEAQGNGATGGAFHVQSTFEWVPYVDYVYARTVAFAQDGAPTHLLDAYVYRHSSTNEVRVLALSKWGGVHEGRLTVLEEDGLQLELKSHEADRTVLHVARFDFEEDGRSRERVWSMEGKERTLVRDVLHRKLEPKKD